jgi:hypothetical protein
VSLKWKWALALAGYVVAGILIWQLVPWGDSNEYSPGEAEMRTYLDSLPYEVTLDDVEHSGGALVSGSISDGEETVAFAAWTNGTEFDESLVPAAAAGEAAVVDQLAIAFDVPETVRGPARDIYLDAYFALCNPSGRPCG